jgi:hypothetical protein
MSTKTLRKRIALVAVTALGAGLLSVVAVPSANAAYAAGDLDVSATASSTNYGIVSVTGATNSTVEMLLTGQLEFAGSGAVTEGTAGDYAKYTITQGSGLFTYATNGSAAGGATVIDGATLATGGATLAASGQSMTWQSDGTDTITGTALYFKPTATGKVVIQYTKKVGSTVSVVETFTVYVVASAAASAAGVLSVADSSFVRVTEATTTIPANGVDATTSSVVNGSCGWIAFNLEDEYGNDLSTGALVATSSSTDLSVIFDTAATTSTSTSTAVKADPGAANYIAVCQTTANKPASGTVSLSYNGTLIGSKSITILGQLASLKISTAVADGLAYAPRNSSSGTHFYVLAYDEAGRRVATSSTPTVDSAGLNPTVTNVTVSGAVSSSSTNAPLGTTGYFTCASDKSGTATIRVKHVNSLGATIYSNTTTARCGGATPYKVTAALDKAIYLPGDIATLTVTATDVAGQPVADTATTGTNFTVSGSNMTAVTAPSSADTFTWGTKTYKFVVGSTEGSYSMAVSIPAYAAYGVTDQTAPYSIKASTATVSNADVLKSIVALIASINKQIQALQKLILKR